MYIPEQPYNEADFIHTSSGNVVSRSAVLHKPESVEIPGGKCFIHNNVQIYGSLAPVKLSRYVIIGDGTKLAPAKLDSSSDPKEVGYIPMSIGTLFAFLIRFIDRPHLRRVLIYSNSEFHVKLTSIFCGFYDR